MSMVCLLETCQLFDTRFLVEMRSRIAPARALSSTARIPRPSIRHMADAHARNRCLECRPNSSELEIGFGGDLCVPDRIPHS